MTHDDAFLQAISESPEDETPRLVYADWLEEHSQPQRAELIRVECALAGLLATAPVRYRLEYRGRQLLCISDGVFRFEGRLAPELERRDCELLATHASEWAEPVRRFVGYAGFRRGFVEEVGMRGRAFLSRAEDIFPLAPIRHVSFSGVPPVLMPLLTASPYLSRLRSLRLAHNRIGPRGARCLAESPHLSRLHTLDLTHCRIEDIGLAALLSSPCLPQLTALHLWNNDLGEASVGPLVCSGLDYLGVGCNRFSEQGQQALRERFGDRVCFELEGAVP
jgi:uncharacterized protein (TIGR02996 family)